ncbi:MAG: sensor histidine kinase [Solirubrobacteraceae bacterium]
MLTGVRGRAAAAFAVVAVVSVGILALVLLPPLEQRLRNDELATLVHAGESARPSVAALSPRHLAAGDRRLREIARTTRRASGAEVAVVAPGGAVLASTDPDDVGGSFPEAAQAIATGQTQRVATDPVDGQAHAALPVRLGDTRVALVLRKPLTEARSAAAVVRRAFLVSAVISLVLALLLGIALARGLSRRLTALRDTALRVAEIGPVAEMRADAARDEVGDLTRAFASMQQRLREQEHARRAFVATASHELRTPLSSLQIMLDMLRSDLESEPADVADARDQARRAEVQAQRLSGLAAELLDLSRIDAGVALRSELVELGESARSAVAELELRAAEAGTDLRADAPEGLWATADPGAVAQILRILIDNALRYGAGAPVHVLAGRDGTSASVTVSDAGPGVAEADRDRIFDRFERGTSSSGAGFGLGLAIARELAQKMGGDLTLGAAGPGARFTLRLPLARREH